MAAGWLRGWLRSLGSCCCWLGGWLGLAVLLGDADEADEEDDSGCGWLAGWLAAKPKIRRRGTLEA